MHYDLNRCDYNDNRKRIDLAVDTVIAKISGK
jgi:hypothetical protein